MTVSQITKKKYCDTETRVEIKHWGIFMFKFKRKQLFAVHLIDFVTTSIFGIMREFDWPLDATSIYRELSTLIVLRAMIQNF